MRPEAKSNFKEGARLNQGDSSCQQQVPETGAQPMKTRNTLLATFLFILVTVAFSQMPRPPVEARPGDIASGVVESEKEGKLYLNTTPCKPAQEADTVVFHKPYTKTAAGEIVCYGHHFDKVSVRQQ
jgi:hypothetical protein